MTTRHADDYSVQSVSEDNKRIILRRDRSSYCDSHKRIHDSNGDVYLNCFASDPKGMGYIIGNIGKNTKKSNKH